MTRRFDSLEAMIADRGRGVLGTWVKLATFETVQLLAYAGFEAIVIDMEHAPLSLARAAELVVCAQASGMLALVRLPDSGGATVQPLLDAGVNGLLVPRVTSPEIADEITRKMIFAPAGDRGLGSTSRAGHWGLGTRADYLGRADQVARFVQLENWQSLEHAEDFAAVAGVGGLFIGHGDLSLSSGRPATDPEVVALTDAVITAAKEAGKLSGVAVGSADEARGYLARGVSLVMLSNDATMFGQAALHAAEAALRS